MPIFHDDIVLIYDKSTAINNSMTCECDVLECHFTEGYNDEVWE